MDLDLDMHELLALAVLAIGALVGAIVATFKGRGK